MCLVYRSPEKKKFPKHLTDSALLSSYGERADTGPRGDGQFTSSPMDEDLRSSFMKQLPYPIMLQGQTVLLWRRAVPLSLTSLWSQAQTWAFGKSDSKTSSLTHLCLIWSDLEAVKLECSFSVILPPFLSQYHSEGGILCLSLSVILRLRVHGRLEAVSM